MVKYMLVLVASTATASELLATATGVSLASLAANRTLINAFNSTTPSSGSTVDSYDSASRCNAASISWSNANSVWSLVTTPQTDCRQVTQVRTVMAPNYNVSVPWTTFCDGHPRTPKSWTYPSTPEPVTYDFMSCSAGVPRRMHSGSFTEPQPDCTIPPKECEQLYSTFIADGGWMNDFDNPAPICTTSAGFDPGCEQCWIYGYGVQLFYWPVETVSGNVCGNNGTTITATPTGSGPNTKVIGGFTFTSPSVYLGFSNLMATAANNTCGTPVYDMTVPLEPFDVSSLSIAAMHSSLCASDTRPGCQSFVASTFQVNYADFNYPVPYSAYIGMPPCKNPAYPDACATVSLPYKPYLALPTWLTGMNTAWQNCSVFATGVFDPPVALAPLQTMQGPVMTTAAGHGSSVSATPVPSATTTVPVETATSSAGSMASSTSESSSESAASDLQPTATATPSGGIASDVSPGTSDGRSGEADPPESTDVMVSSSTIERSGSVLTFQPAGTASPEPSSQLTDAESAHAALLESMIISAIRQGLADPTNAASSAGNAQMATRSAASCGDSAAAVRPTSTMSDPRLSGITTSLSTVSGRNGLFTGSATRNGTLSAASLGETSGRMHGQSPQSSIHVPIVTSAASQKHTSRWIMSFALFLNMSFRCYKMLTT